MDDDSLNQTIEDDLNKKRTHIPGERKIKNKAKKEAKKLAKKGVNKLKKSLFSKVGASVFGTVAAVVIVIFMLIGIITFIFTMPGLVQENILKKVNEVLDTASGLFVANDVKYLSELASTTPGSKGYQARINVLMYLEDMGIDPVGYGFAPFYESYYDEDGTKTATYDIDILAEYNSSLDEEKNLLSEFIDSAQYNKDMKAKVRKEDLIYKYIVSNERTYLIYDLDETNLDFVSNMLGYDNGLHGMIEMKIEGLNDSSIEVDRENKQMIISSLNATDFKIQDQEGRYNLESWAGRYGKSLEFLLALHIATMSPDLTQELVTNSNLETTVKVEGNKGVYDVKYDITYEGKDLGIPRGTQASETFLYDKGADIISVDENGKYGVSYTEQEAKNLVGNDRINLMSLGYWMHNLNHVWELREDTGIDVDDFNGLANDVKSALLKNDESRFVAQYRYVITDSLSAALINNTSYIGKFKDEGVFHTQIDERLKNDYDTGWNTGGTSTVNGYIIYLLDGASNDSIISVPGNSYIPVSNLGQNYKEGDNIDEIINYDNFNENVNNDECTPIDDYPTVSTIRRTVTLHSLPYYIEHIDEIRNHKYIRKGIEAVLSQLDAQLYERNSTSQLLNFTKYQIGDSSFTCKVDDTETDGNERIAYFLLTEEWINFCKDLETNGKTNDEIEIELQTLIDHIYQYYGALDNRDEHLNEILSDMLQKIGLSAIINVDTLEQIYNALKGQSDDFEFVQPRIKYVIKHWFKDVVFELEYYTKDKNGGSVQHYVNVYKTDKKLTYDVKLDDDLDGKIKLTANLKYKSGDKAKEQKGQPFVVKGDVVTLDGEIVTEGEGSGLAGASVKVADDKTYALGTGYKVAKKLFTQGQYYVYDGTKETSHSIYYAKEIEKLKANSWAKVIVKQGRITAFRNLTDSETTDGFKKIVSDDSYDVYVKNGKNEGSYFYIINTKEDMKYISVGSLETDIFEKSKKSVDKINGLLNSMGVITIRKPVSFDNTTAGGDVTAVTAFSILEGMHTQDAEHIYRDLKEFLIELGYYTKAEFEYIETNVLEWFIPDYRPDNIENWNQSDGNDVLKYGAIIYQQKEDESGEVHNGFTEDLDIVAPGTAKILEKSTNKIKIEFDGKEQPEVGSLDKYTMIITGTGISITTEKNVGDIIEVKDVLGKTVTTEKQDAYIQVILKNKLDGYVSNVQDYMKPQVGVVNGDVVQVDMDDEQAIELIWQFEGVSDDDPNDGDYYTVCVPAGDVAPTVGHGVTAATVSVWEELGYTGYISGGQFVQTKIPKEIVDNVSKRVIQNDLRALDEKLAAQGVTWGGNQKAAWISLYYNGWHDTVNSIITDWASGDFESVRHKWLEVCVNTDTGAEQGHKNRRSQEWVLFNTGELLTQSEAYDLCYVKKQY